MTIDELLQAKREEILRIAERHGARNVRVFGSAVRGEATEGSDVDLPVSASGETSPWFPAGLVEELEALLGRKVDVATEDGLYWLLRRRILRQARPVTKDPRVYLRTSSSAPTGSDDTSRMVRRLSPRQLGLKFRPEGEETAT